MVNLTLVVMAAGMGSRFGGLKQITPVDEQDHMIIDFSLYDAKLAGFDTVVFVIKHAIEKEFEEMIGSRIEKHFKVHYVFQEVNRIPEGFSVPEGRTKPWGTGHAVACTADVVDGPFAVINADDFYGRTALSSIGSFLSESRPDTEHAMVGYLLRNTVTEHGYVARGVCDVEDGMLRSITERTRIEKRGNDASFTEDGVTYEPLSGDTVVSMNMWGFQKEILPQFQSRFVEFLEKVVPSNPLKSEFFLPSVADAQIKEGLGSVRVLPTEETWYGVTYREDLERVMVAITNMKNSGIYPERLWEEK